MRLSLFKTEKNLTFPHVIALFYEDFTDDSAFKVLDGLFIGFYRNRRRRDDRAVEFRQCGPATADPEGCNDQSIANSRKGAPL